MKFLVATAIAILATIGNSLRCAQGSVPSKLNVCISPQYIEGCNVYSSETQCKVCNYKYQLQENGLCSYNTKSSENCCIVHGRDGNCLECNRGLTLIKGTCQQIRVLGCLQITDNSKCGNCAKGFYLENGQCLKGIKNCNQYNDTERKICAQCKQSYSLISNYCLENKILGCKKQESNICVDCHPPFALSSGNCEIKNCKTYTDFGCASCDCGFYITKNRICEKIEEGCIRHQKGVCTDCYPPFQLQGTSCALDGCKVMNGMKCNKCSQNYQLQNGLCSLPNCLEGSNGKCKACKNGFNYRGGSCVKQTQKLVFN